VIKITFHDRSAFVSTNPAKLSNCRQSKVNVQRYKRTESGAGAILTQSEKQRPGTRRPGWSEKGSESAALTRLLASWRALARTLAGWRTDSQNRDLGRPAAGWFWAVGLMSK
jgi:hypothetical protein